MTLQSCNLSNNYFTKIDHTKIYVDYTNKLVRILDLDNISILNIKRIIHFSSKQHLGKIICNCDGETSIFFRDAKFKLEGTIEGYFKGKDAFCMSYFIHKEREICNDHVRKDSLLRRSVNVKNAYTHSIYNSKYCIRNANEDDIDEMAELFSKTFSTYPYPIYDKEYLRRTINKQVLYKIAVYDKKVIGIASAIMDKNNLNAEIADCATYPLYRCKGILSNIVYSLEEDLKNKGFITLFSLSRATNISMNIVLSKYNYKFGGRLINNCNICGTFEDMNIWFKDIRNIM
ncbi:putative beta-lysine N-acetyltransferase [Clostridium oryzae]|uniref:N-acetyltransferase YodP n=1 Tax=Clostridium oryzae TaxID=1450648 RepID=A0A1V4IWK1_9CLOT|nr:putative beta-lysine N-acetyltransferase [Clostridium oryzae]OPJ64428.1 N-acetyltransferase YodP [Clostridium oryzae]